MRDLARYSMVFALGICSLAAFADSPRLRPTVVLQDMQVLGHNEKDGDELYIAVTTYRNNGKTEHYRRPEYPLYWHSKHLQEVHHATLWQADLADGEAVTVIFSLIEADAPPWDTDDLLGTVHLHVENKAGYLVSEWKSKEHAYLGTYSNHGKTQHFALHSEEGDYRLSLTISDGLQPQSPRRKQHHQQ